MWHSTNCECIYYFLRFNFLCLANTLLNLVVFKGIQNYNDYHILYKWEYLLKKQIVQVLFWYFGVCALLQHRMKIHFFFLSVFGAVANGNHAKVEYYVNLIKEETARAYTCRLPQDSSEFIPTSHTSECKIFVLK